MLKFYCLFVLFIILLFKNIQGAAWNAGDLVKEFGDRDLNECRKKGESCWSYPKCCDKLQCYWAGGISIWNTKGECVECVDRGLECQRDAQCCGTTLICQKDKSTDVNGICDILRSKGEKCHEDNQCISNSCKTSWFSGKCE